jgi:hypothetical protein
MSDDILKDLKDAEKEANKEIIEDPLLNDVISDLLMIDDVSDTRRRDKIIQMLEHRKDISEI